MLIQGEFTVMTKSFKFLMATSFLSVLVLSSCTNNPSTPSETSPMGRTFTVLNDNQSLYVQTNGNDSERFMNYELSSELEIYLEVITRKTYTLNRSVNQFGLTDAYFYNGFWYTLTVSVETDEELLGMRTQDLSYEVSYLILETNEAIAIRETATITTTFDYVGGWTNRTFVKRLILNNWFTETTLQAFLPDLYTKIDANNIETYYLDVTVPTVFESQINFVDGFYYFSSVE